MKNEMKLDANLDAILAKIEALPEKKRQAFVQLLRQQGVDVSSLLLSAQVPNQASSPASSPALRARARTAADGQALPLPLSAAQQRLWFLARLDGSSVYYNIPLALRLRGPLQVEALRGALRALVARHEVLRTRFVEVDGLPRQVIDPMHELPLVEEVLAAGTDLAALCSAEAMRAFDLERDWLIRMRLLRVAADELVLLVVMHHSVSDGWSLGVFFRDLLSLYGQASGLAAASPALPELTLQYADYAIWQREWLAGQVQARQLDYWRQQLQGVEAQLPLPLDFPRPPQKTYHGAHHRFNCAPELLLRLQTVARSQDCTLYMLLLAGYAMLLQRYSRQNDIAIGTPHANRNRLETENLIGFFVNTLVMRADLDGNPDFATFLARIKATALQAYANQDVPFEAVVDALQVERSLSYAPLFQVMFALQEARTERHTRMGEVEVELVDFDFKVTKFDLTLEMRETADGLLGSIEYNTDLFSPATIERMAAHYCALLQAVCADPQQKLDSYSCLLEGERERLLQEYNPHTAFDQQRCLHELFEEQVALHPQRTALSFEGQSLSYAELNARANQVAHWLHAQGVQADTLIGLCVERSFDLLIGALGIIKAGAAYVPLDPAYPEQRLAHVLQDARLQWIVTQERVQHSLPAGAHKMLFLDSGRCQGSAENVLAGQPVTNLGRSQTGVSADNLLYVIYTSGSTGLPKGVLIQHNNVNRLFSCTEQYFSFNQHDVWTLFHSFAFDFSVWEMWGALLYGARLVIVPKAVAQVPADFYQLLHAERVTVLNQTPSAFEFLLEVDRQRSLDLSLRTVIFGGEALQPAILEPWFARHDQEKVAMVNMYGITETTVHVTYQRMYAGSGQKSIVGRKLPDLRLYVLDTNLQPVPVGVPGEMYVGGAGVARGYLHRPELNAARFLPDPFQVQMPGQNPPRLYKTGDLARWLEDGNLEFIGRADLQVKIRGFRIETGEIEAQLLKTGMVKSALVLVREDVPGNKQLVAYLVLQDGAQQVPAELARQLRHVLPDYMVPGAYVCLPAFPLTANGKLDRNALPAPDDQAYAFASYVAPATREEQMLVQLWADLLGFEAKKISIRDNFFALGGHSLLITVLVARLRDLGWQVAVREVFASPDLATLATHLQPCGQDGAYQVPPNLLNTAHGPATVITPELLPLFAADAQLSAEQIAQIVAGVPGGAANVQDIYPLVPSQHGIFFHHLLNPGHDPYLIPVLLAARDESSSMAFVQALRDLIARHDVMRTAVLADGLPEPVQVVYRNAPLDVQRITLAQEQDSLAQARELLANAPGMSLHQAPLLRLTLAQKPGEARCYILLQIHHLIEDASSLRLIFAELIARMAGRFDAAQPAVPYRDFVAHTLHQLRSNDAAAYFRARLGTVSEPTLPFNLRDVRGDGRRILDLRLSLPEQLAQQLRQQAQHLHLSPASIFHAAWALLIAHCSGRDEVVFGTVLSGRLQGVAGVERMLGNFINTLPLHIVVRAQSALELVKNTDRQLKELIQFEQASLVLAQSCSGLDGEQTLFTSMINFRHFEADQQNQPDLAQVGMEWLGSLDRTNYPLGVSIDDLGQVFSLNLQVDDSLQAQDVMDVYLRALEVLVQALQQKQSGSGADLLQVSLLPAALRQRQLQEWATATGVADAARPPLPQLSLPQLFARQVARAPQALALVCGEQRLSYAELDVRSSQLAHYLLAQGVVREQMVAMCLPRSVDMVVAILAILKAGAAYVPLDPAYPQARLAFILQEVQARHVLTCSSLRPNLPLENAAQVLELDKLQMQLAQQPGHAPDLHAIGLLPQHLAYVIFTSGSTGKPKGVQVEQRGVARLVLNPDYFPGTPATIMLQHCSISFDVGSQEVLGPLLTGGRLVLHEGETRDMQALLQTVLREQVNTMCLSAAFLPALVAHTAELAAAPDAAQTFPLRYLGVGGEAFAARDVRTLYQRFPHLQIVNAYGPTENSIASTCHPIPRDLAADAAIPIGKPIAWSTAYVLGPDLQLLPPGVAGQLALGGEGLARGYLNQEQLTQEKFIYLELEPGQGRQRLYLSGDLVRWLADGSLEFCGRVDQQVKIRGHRIELGEVEQSLASHPAVKSVHVRAVQDAAGKHLAAWVCPSDAWLAEHAASLGSDSLQHWNTLFEDEYAHQQQTPQITPTATVAPAALSAADLEAAFAQDVQGWNSSYSGQAIAVAEMREWVDGSVERIKACGARRVLEIGCGTGLLLYRYAGECEQVHAIDISASVLRGVRQRLQGLGWHHVSLAQGDALSLAGVRAGQEFDLVVINSVLQYFPSQTYLEQVLQAVLPHVAQGGRIFLGDVRNYDLFAAHLTAIERTRAERSQSSLAARIQRRMQQETELLISPAFFAHFAAAQPGWRAADILLKRGYGENEMLSYRYDVVLHKQATEATADSHPLPWLPAGDWQQVQSVLQQAQQQGLPQFGIAALPNPRVAADAAQASGAQAFEVVRTASRLSPQAQEMLHLWQDLYTQAQACGYTMQATWSERNPAQLDLLFAKGQMPPVQAQAPYLARRVCNYPHISRCAASLVPLLKTHLQQQLAAYMLPSAFVILENLPLTPNGKVDAQALPRAQESDLQSKAYQAAQGELEQKLCDLVQEVLELKQVGRHDHFFELGGHSLLATRLTLRVRQELGLVLPLRAVLEEGTVAAMAALLSTADTQEEGAELHVGLEAGTEGEAVGLSLAQSELWFLTREAGRADQNVQLAYRMIGKLNRQAYLRAWDSLFARHSVLRTRFLQDADGNWQQQVLSLAASGLQAQTVAVADEAAAQEWLEAERLRPFLPQQGANLRVHLLVFSEYEHLAVVTRPWGVLDGSSTGYLFAELGALYHAISQGGQQSTPPVLPPMPVQYADFARWQQQVWPQARLQQEIGLWQQHLQGMQRDPGLRADYPRPASASGRGGAVDLSLPAGLVQHLQQFCQQQGISLYMGLLAAYALLLLESGSARDFAIASPVSNRPHPWLEQMPGYFVNLVLLRVRAHPQHSLQLFLQNIRSAASFAFEHKEVPYVSLAHSLQAQDGAPLCRAMFNLVQVPEQESVPGANLAILPLPQQVRHARFDLGLVLQESAQGLHGYLEYNSDLFTRSTAQHLAQRWQSLVLRMLTCAEQEMSTVQQILAAQAVLPELV